MPRPSFGDPLPIGDDSELRAFKLPADGADWRCNLCDKRFPYNQGALILNVTQQIHANLCDDCIKQKLGPNPMLIEPTHVWEKLVRKRI